MTLRTKRTFSRRDPRKGFTLIELLVVIAIIGILAAVVLVSLNSARARGRDARRISDMQSIALAMELYADANGSLFPNDGDIAAPNAAAFGVAVGTLQTDGYLPQIPADPVTGNVYVADVTGAVGSNGDTFSIGVDLEQPNPACVTDWDGAGAAPRVDLEGGAASLCDGDTVAADCNDFEGASYADAIVDFCICSGAAC